MKRLFTLATVVLVGACATPEPSWQPTTPAFGNAQAVSQSAFCGSVLHVFAAIAQSPAEAAEMGAAAAAAEERLQQLGADDLAKQDGRTHAVLFMGGATVEQLLAARDLCVDVAEGGL